VFETHAAALLVPAQIGSVIRNPEIMDLVPHLLAAIADPNNATKPALEVLLQTVFVNTIDAASLVRSCLECERAGVGEAIT